MRSHHFRRAGLAVAVLIALALITGRAVALPAIKNISNNAGASFLPSLGMVGTTLIAIWTDLTPGNREIFMARSTDTGVTWDAPVNLSNTSDVSGGGTGYDWTFAGRYLYVAWAEGSTPDIHLRRSTDGGATFGAAVNVSANAGSSSLPHIALSGGSNVYVVWEDNTPGNSDIFFKRSVDGGVSFGTFKNLSNDATLSHDPIILAVGPLVYVLWRDEGTTDVYLRRSFDAGATWGSVLNISSSAGGSDHPAIAVGGPNVYVAWEDDVGSDNYETLLRISTDGGATFGASTNLSMNSGWSVYPRVIIAGSFIFVLWEQHALSGDPADLYLRRSTDGGATWSAVTNISNNVGSSEGRLASWTLAGTELSIVWPDWTPSGTVSPDILYRRSGNAGGTFNASVNLSNNAGYSTNPQILAIGRDVFVLWEDNDPGNSDILYMRSQQARFSSFPLADPAMGWAGGTSNPSVPDFRCVRRTRAGRSSPGLCAGPSTRR